MKFTVAVPKVCKRYLLDTNAFIQLLSGNGSVRTIIDDADFLSTSVICQAEFLAYPKLDPETRNAFLQFLSRIHVYDVLSSDDALMRETVSMRVESGLKLPDAFIAATALVNGCECDGSFPFRFFSILCNSYFHGTVFVPFPRRWFDPIRTDRNFPFRV